MSVLSMNYNMPFKKILKNNGARIETLWYALENLQL